MEYIIEEGNHYPNDIHNGQTYQEFKLKFDDNCWYVPLDSENDYNKVFGWSYGVIPRIINEELKPAHHINSIRISWRPNPEREGCIEVNLYLYEDGVRRYPDIGLMLKVEKEYTGKLYYILNDGCNPGKVFLDIKGVGSISMDYNAKPIKGYELNPYFGGNAPAPNTMTINIIKTE